MNFMIHKCDFSKFLKNCGTKIRFKSFGLENKLLNFIDEMPRKKKKSFSDKSDESLSFVGLEVLGNTSSISPCGVTLNTNARSYLFNCGEGLQKILSEYKIKPSRYKDIFITYPSWKNIGGLIGTTLSLQESNVKSFTIHGHSCLGGLFNLTKKIVNFKGIKISERHCDHNSEFSDEYITVKYIRLNESDSGTLKKDAKKVKLCEEDEVGTSNIKFKEELNIEEHFSEFSKSKHCNEAFESKENEIHLNNKDKNFALSFIIHTQKSTGSLSFEKCMDLGVPVGPLLGKLKKGEDVQLENGNIVKSSAVKFPDLPGVIVIVVECPSEDYLDSLLNERAFFEHQFKNIEHYACAVVHFSNSKIIKNRKYLEWIGRFDKETKHIFVNESSEIGAFVGLHRHQFKLSMVHEEIFPPLHSLGIPDFPRSKNCKTDEGHTVVDISPCLHDKNSPSQIHSDKIYYQCKNNLKINGETLCEVILKPKRNYDYSKCLTLKKNEYLQEVLEVPNFISEFQKLKEKYQNVEKVLQSEKKIYPKIVFLGTGSKKPSKTRNASGILVFLDEEKSVILDCGESIFCQLLTLYGKEKTAEILRNLSAIFVSHLHVDHHLGLAKLLMERKAAFGEWDDLKSESTLLTSKEKNNTSFTPVNLIAPVQLHPLLHYLTNEIFNFSGLYTMIPCTVLIEPPQEEKFKEVISSLNLDSLQTVYVSHAPHSFGISITHKNGWKLTYSGDTKPCKELITIGKNSDILIHEATFDDIFEAEANEKLHSTTGQAILAGREMNAKFTLLTHFSQRYCHLPMIKDELLSKNDVGVAFDFMQVSPHHFPLLPYLYEPLQLIFTTYQEKLEHQDAMLKLRKERNMHLNETFSKINNIPRKIPKLRNS